jgi:hypothetical protein
MDLLVLVVGLTDDQARRLYSLFERNVPKGIHSED